MVGMTFTVSEWYDSWRSGPPANFSLASGLGPLRTPGLKEPHGVR
jgi:hypothetical protein